MSMAIRQILGKDSMLPHSKKSIVTFIDLFAGIGGMRMAFEKAGGRCVYSSEWSEQPLS